MLFNFLSMLNLACLLSVLLYMVVLDVPRIDFKYGGDDVIIFKKDKKEKEYINKNTPESYDSGKTNKTVTLGDIDTVGGNVNLPTNHIYTTNYNINAINDNINSALMDINGKFIPKQPAKKEEVSALERKLLKKDTAKKSDVLKVLLTKRTDDLNSYINKFIGMGNKADSRLIDIPTKLITKAVSPNTYVDKKRTKEEVDMVAVRLELNKYVKNLSRTVSAVASRLKIVDGIILDARADIKLALDEELLDIRDTLDTELISINSKIDNMLGVMSKLIEEDDEYKRAIQKTLLSCNNVLAKYDNDSDISANLKDGDNIHLPKD